MAIPIRPPEKPQIVFTAPIEPETLNRMMQAVAPRLGGAVAIPNYRLTFLVPAGGKVEVPFPLPTGFVCTRRSPLRFESNYYSKDILVDVSCDGEPVNPYPLPLTHPFEVDFGIYYIKKARVDIKFTNNSVIDAEITFQVIPHIIAERLYRTWYEPLVNLAFDLLGQLAIR